MRRIPPQERQLDNKTVDILQEEKKKQHREGSYTAVSFCLMSKKSGIRCRDGAYK
jgi:hypothetical protein